MWTSRHAGGTRSASMRASAGLALTGRSFASTYRKPRVLVPSRRTHLLVVLIVGTLEQEIELARGEREERGGGETASFGVSAATRISSSGCV